MYEYRVLTTRQLSEIDSLPEQERDELLDKIENGWGGDPDWQAYLVLFKDDKFMRIVGRDGGESEDNSFFRDYSWVAKELNDLVKLVYKE